MSIFQSIFFFGHNSTSINSQRLKKSIQQSELTGQNNSKYLSIFHALDKDKSGILDDSEIQNMYDTLSQYAGLDNEKKDLSVDEMIQYLNSLSNNNGETLAEFGISALDMYNFINEYALQTKIDTPEYLVLIKTLSNNQDINIDITTNIDLEQYRNLENLLSNYTNKYNLVNEETNNQTITDMQAVVNDFFGEYGHSLVSTSREDLLTEHITKETGEKYDYVRFAMPGTVKSRQEWLAKKELIKQSNFANCGECQDMILDILNQKYDGQYDFKAIDISCKINSPCEEGYNTHCAVLVTNEQGEEYVIDMWLDPNKGGIFKKSDWEKLVSEIYGTNEYKIETNNNFLTSINQ